MRLRIINWRFFAHALLVLMSLLPVGRALAQNSPGPTPQPYTAFEDPLKPNERVIPRDQFTPEMEAYWGIKLSEIEDEKFVRKETETLHINAAGTIILKQHTDTYHGETGSAYATDEEMFTIEGRWEELREYQRKLREKLQPAWSSVVAAATPGFLIFPERRTVAPGREVTLQISTTGLDDDVLLTAGLVLGFDPQLLQVQRVLTSNGVRVHQSGVRSTGTVRDSVRLRFERTPRPPGSSRLVLRVQFKALVPGTALIEPLSVSADATFGRTFLHYSDQLIAPKVNDVTVQIR